MITQEFLCSRVLFKLRKGSEKASDIDIRRARRMPPLPVLARELYIFKLIITVNQKNVSKL